MYLKSDEIAWSANLAKSLNMAFLTNGVKDLDDWDVDHIRFAVEYSITPDSTKYALGKDFARIFETVWVKDVQGQRTNLSGPNMRREMQAEQGDRFADPADSAQSTNTTGTFYLYHYFAPPSQVLPRGHRDPRDLRCPLKALAGGSIRFKLSPATITDDEVNIISATIYAEAKLVRRYGRRAEAPARMVFDQQNFTAKEQTFPFKGSLRRATGYADLGIGAATGASIWTSSNYDEVDSKSLGYSDKKRLALVEEYENAAARNVTVDEVSTSYAFPFFTPEVGQKLSQLPDLNGLHVRLAATAPATAQMVLCYIDDTGKEFGEAATGVPEQVWDRTVKERGLVATRDGRRVRVQTVGLKRAKRMPIKIG